MNKSQALARLPFKANPERTLFLSVNKAKPVWWFDIPVHKVDSDHIERLIFITHDHVTHQLYVFDVPTSFLREHRHRLYNRADKDMYSIELSTAPSQRFRNVRPADSGLDFAPFLAHTIDLSPAVKPTAPPEATQAEAPKQPGSLHPLPCWDSEDIGARAWAQARMSREHAAELGRSAVEAAETGCYVAPSGRQIDWQEAVGIARGARRSIAPDAPLPPCRSTSFRHTEVQVRNESTLEAARRLVECGMRPLALNFANGSKPGGAFLAGARAQEEALCRSSALYETLVGDEMYVVHRQRPLPDSTSWAILSPCVPVFRADNGTNLEQFWLLDFITCAAPYAPTVGQPRSAELLRERIHRVLEIAHAHGYINLVLGAWGCGAFGNDPERTARDFRQALGGEFRGAFRHVVFAIRDWSPERNILAPFRDVFASA